MRIAKILLASAAVTGALTTGALAGDWSGGYVGVFGEGTFIMGPPIAGGAPGVRWGYNLDFGGFVWGVEGAFQWYPNIGGGLAELSISSRVGADLGSAFWYGSFGAGVDFGAARYVSIGTGLEAMVSDSVSLRADYKFKIVTAGFPTVSHNFSGGISFYFGR